MERAADADCRQALGTGIKFVSGTDQCKDGGVRKSL